MSIVKELTQQDFVDGLKGDGFSYDGAVALYEYYEQLSEEMGEPMEFDNVAIRCEWSEYDSLQAAYSDFEKYEDETDEEIEEYFEGYTQTITLDNGHVLIQEF